jgi:hypothetical protein
MNTSAQQHPADHSDDDPAGRLAELIRTIEIQQQQLLVREERIRALHVALAESLIERNKLQRDLDRFQRSTAARISRNLRRAGLLRSGSADDLPTTTFTEFRSRLMRKVGRR